MEENKEALPEMWSETLVKYGLWHSKVWEMQIVDKLVKDCAWLLKFKRRYYWYSLLEKCGSTLLDWKRFAVLQWKPWRRNIYFESVANSLTKVTLWIQKEGILKFEFTNKYNYNNMHFTANTIVKDDEQWWRKSMRERKEERGASQPKPKPEKQGLKQGHWVHEPCEEDAELLWKRMEMTCVAVRSPKPRDVTRWVGR